MSKYFNHFYFSIILLLISFCYILFAVIIKNSNSKTIVFSSTTVAAAIVMLLLNIYFELKSKKEEYFINTQLSILYEKKEISPYIYLPGTGQRLFFEQKINEFIKNNFESLLKTYDKEKIMHDFLIFSIYGRFIEEHIDWKSNSKNFLNHSQRTFRTKKTQRNKDTFITKKEFQELLNSNIFSNIDIESISEGITLPPNTKIFYDNNSLSIDNEHVNIQIFTEWGGNINYMKPGNNYAIVEKLESGENKYETRDYNINIKILYKAIRSGNKSKEEIENWVKDLLFGLKNWFSVT